VAIEEGSDLRRPDSPRLLSAVTAGLALSGGIVILAAAILVCISVVLRWTTSNSVPGDFELVQIAVALSAFAFMPYCQLRRGNISVSTFTSSLPARLRRTLDTVWDLLFAAVAGFIAWRLAIGAMETIANRTTTMISGLPIGWAIAAVSAMAALLALTALAGAIQQARRAK
jgi:TRAP-type C4-dicarboxylate transport system permease small subunit